jgi:hypothetical protein
MDGIYLKTTKNTSRDMIVHAQVVARKQEAPLKKPSRKIGLVPAPSLQR